jgi:hypothetical protein
MSASRIPVCTTIDSGIVYARSRLTLTDGSMTSPNMSRGTGSLLELLPAWPGVPAKGGDYSQLKNGESTKLPGNLDTTRPKTARCGFRPKTRQFPTV